MLIGIRVKFSLICQKKSENKERIKATLYINEETFEKCSILVKIKEDENFNHRNMLNISRIEI